MKRRAFTLVVLLGLASLPACASRRPWYPAGFSVDVVVDGRPAMQYAAHGTRYIEAIKGRPYSIRLRNPLGIRVAVALSVDGLNTIDARHSDARSAAKWVLGPYETLTISGWQTSGQQARSFYFTSEEDSYGAFVGKTQNLGVITAAFFRERVPPPPPPAPIIQDGRGKRQEAPGAKGEAQSGMAERANRDAAAPSSQPREQTEEYAATGMGQRYEHQVTRVHMNLEDSPVAVLNVRYEYRAQLARLGVIPQPPQPDTLARRQRAHGFSDGYCPEPK